MTPAGARVVARCNGTVLTEADGRLGLVTIGGGWFGTAVFVAGLLTVIPGINAVVMLAMRQWLAGVILIAVAIAAGAATVAFHRRRRAARTAPPPAPWLIFDLPAGVVRDARGAALAPIAQVTLRRTFQVGSSSKALSLQLPAQTIVLARGTPFGDSVDALDDALRAALGRR